MIRTLQKAKVKSLFERCKKDAYLFAKTFRISPQKQPISPKQKEVFDAVTRNEEHIVLLWSRQTGKSTVLSEIIVWWLLCGSEERVFVLAPVEDQSKEIYDKIARILLEYPFFERFVIKNNSEEIKMNNGNFVKFMSASPGSHIRGKTATRIIIDETEDVIDEKYYGDITPFLAAIQRDFVGKVKKKTLIEAGTPKTKNHFYEVLSKGGVKVIGQKWYECPFIDVDFVLKQKAKNPEALFKQEYLCEFIEEGSTCFPIKWFFGEKIDENNKILNPNENRVSAGLSNIDLIVPQRCFHTPEELMPFVSKIRGLVEKGAIFTMGYDQGRQIDNAALCVWRVDKFPVRLYYNQEFPLGTTNPTIIKVMKLLYKTFDAIEINVDWTGEKGFQDFMIEAGLPCPIKKPDYKYGLIVFNPKTKTEMITKAQALVQKGLIRLPESEHVLFQQFTQQQYEITGNNKFKFYHPSNSHDDQLWATLLALKNVEFDMEDVEKFFVANIWKQTEEMLDFEDSKKDFMVLGKKKYKNLKIGTIESNKKNKKIHKKMPKI